MSFWRTGMLGLVLLFMAATSDASAQPVPVMGYVAAKNANPKRLEVFRQGLAELGYVEGKNLLIEYREAILDGEYDGVMADLVGRKIDIIVAANVAATVAASKATNTIPIVMLAVLAAPRSSPIYRKTADTPPEVRLVAYGHKSGLMQRAQSHP
jgi:putative ABC transport system substrate-binding protein